ncbi:hypothetical protein GCM10009812_21570 [Nocardioides marinus]
MVVFHPAVEDDIAAIQAHYEQIDPVLPDRFESRLDDQVERLSMFPESGAVTFDVYRRVLVKRVPYIANYRVVHRWVEVSAIVSTRMTPPRSRRWLLSGRGSSARSLRRRRSPGLPAARAR